MQHRFQTKNWLQKQQMIEEEERERDKMKNQGNKSSVMSNEEYERLKKQYESSNTNAPKLLFPTSYHIQQSLKKTTSLSVEETNVFQSVNQVKQEVFQRNTFPQSSFEPEFFPAESESESRPYSPSSIASSEIADDISMNFLNFDGPDQYDSKMEMESNNNNNNNNNNINNINNNNDGNVATISNSSNGSVYPQNNTILINQSTQMYGMTTQTPSVMSATTASPGLNTNINTNATAAAAVATPINLNVGLTQMNLGLDLTANPIFTFNGPNQMTTMDWVNMNAAAQNQILNSQVTFHNGTKTRPASSRSSSVKPEVEIKSEIDDSTNEKLKKRRESHNAVERRRRDNINERINELSILVPDCIDPTGNAKPNKGHVLRKSADYIRYLQEANRKLELLVQQQQQLLQTQSILDQAKMT